MARAAANGSLRHPPLSFPGKDRIMPAAARNPVGATGAVRLTDRIGSTPLIDFGSLVKGLDGKSIRGKAEWFNPGGSVKDRPAFRIIREAELAGDLRPGKTILDASSGNTGIAYAWIGAALGYPVRLVVPANASPSRKRLLAAYGARVTYTDPLGGMDAAIDRAHELFVADPDTYFYANQYCNPANWMAHYDSTALEIWRQSSGSITHFVAGLGTSGTFVGTVRRLKALNPDIVAVSVEPDGPFHGIEGLKHMASSLVPGIYDPGLADVRLCIRTEDAEAMARRVAREEGALVGTSAGAALAACVEIARGLPRDRAAHIVTVLGDGGDRYLEDPQRGAIDKT